MTVRQRGQPLIFLAMVVVLWIGARILISGGPAPEADLVVIADAAPPGPSASGQVSAANLAEARSVTAHLVAVRPARRSAAPERQIFMAARVSSRAGQALAVPPLPASRREPAASAVPSVQPTAMPASLNLSLPPPHSGARRWSGDAWALVRSGGGTTGAGPGAGTYGGNQIGGVLRYRLAPGNRHRPTAYFRVTAALNGSGEREAALGLSVRPVGEVPIYVAAEGRVGTFSGRTFVRPAVMAVTEFRPLRLPGKARAEFYAQAGYVGGTNATPFGDGQVKVDRRVVQAGPLEVRAGAGAWAGAQRGAARFDVGPSATLGISRGAASARFALDWRFRLAGDARPASGPALTVSAGF